MCGIAGIVGPGASPFMLDEMLQGIQHRGEPCFRKEIHFIERCAVGTNRLAISDPSGGKQPVFSRDGTLCLVYNGELYNTNELYRNLKTHFAFSTECDSEVLLAAVLQWGEKCVEYLRGMFAFAVINLKELTCFLARDPLGIKPLYYSVCQDRLIFASELKAFAKIPNIETIESLEPGTVLTSSGPRRYYSIPNFSTGESLGEDLVSSLRENLLEVVRSHIPNGHTKLACLLSGGIDSSSVLLALKMLHGNVEAWTFAHPGDYSEDLSSSRQLCRELDIPHVIVSPSVRELQEFYLSHGVYMVETYEPALVRNAVSYYFLCRAISKQGYCLSFSGEGADEVFGGYRYLDSFPSLEREYWIRESLRNVNRTYLQMADRASMFSTLEVRVPYMDSRFVDFSCSLPPSSRWRDGINKAALREAFPELPLYIRQRPKVGMNQGAGYGSNDPENGIYFQAVAQHYRNYPDRVVQDRSIVASSPYLSLVNTADCEEVYNAARFIENGYARLRGCGERCQLNTSSVVIGTKERQHEFASAISL